MLCGKKKLLVSENGLLVYRDNIFRSTVVPATAGPLGERPHALAGHFCNVPTTLPC